MLCPVRGQSDVTSALREKVTPDRNDRGMSSADVPHPPNPSSYCFITEVIQTGLELTARQTSL